MTSPAGRKKWLLFFRTGRGNLSSQHCKSIPQGTENWYSYVSTPARLISLTNQHLVFLSCEQCLHCPIDWGFVTPCNPVHILYHTYDAGSLSRALSRLYIPLHRLRFIPGISLPYSNDSDCKMNELPLPVKMHKYCYPISWILHAHRYYCKGRIVTKWKLKSFLQQYGGGEG